MHVAPRRFDPVAPSRFGPVAPRRVGLGPSVSASLFCGLVFLLSACSQRLVADAVAAGDAVLLLDCGIGDPARQAFIVYESAAPPGLAFHIAAEGDTSYVIDISGPSNASGTPVHMWGSYSPPVANQMWDLLPDGSVRSRYNGMCLGAGGAGSPPGSPPTFGATLEIFACNGSDPSQRFAYAPASYTLSSASSPALCVQSANATPSCASAPFRSLPYCNASLPAAERVADLVQRMTSAEKAAALDSSVPAIARLGVPAMGSGEALHGAATGCLGAPAPGSTGCPTSFPCPAAMGSAFDAELWGAVGLAIGTEARALYNLGAGAVWLFAPNINPSRDIRWGRTQEVPSEDATVVSNYATAFVSGLQGKGGVDPGHLLTAATLKHFVAYDLEGYIPRTDPLPRPASALCDTPGGCQRWNFDALVNARDLSNYYLPPFQAGVAAGARAVMCAYSAVSGVPSCASPLLGQLLREAMNFSGHVVSDCTALELMGDAKYDGCAPPYPPVDCVPDYFPSHNYTSGPVETALASFAGGTDVNCGPFFRMWLAGLVANGSVPSADVDESVTRLYRSAVLLGLLDPASPEATPYAYLNASVVDSPAHRALALDAAQESLVLLSNAGKVLPLAAQGASMRLAFIGPHANSTDAFLSNYHGSNELVYSHSPLMAALARGLDVTYAPGCNICDVVPPGFPNMPCPPGGAVNASGIPSAVAAAAAADVAVLFVGLDQTSEAENFDRDGLALPGVQEQLALAVIAAQPRTVVVFVSGGLVSAPAVLAGAAAAMQATYGGELAGDAIVNALCGAFSPAGKLAQTMYYQNFTERDIRDVDLASAGGITHSFFSGPVVLPFGWGLSYTEFDYSASTALSATRMQRGSLGALALRAVVTNTGNFTSDCVVLVFLLPPPVAATPNETAKVLPRQALLTFTRLHALRPQETRTHDFELSAADVFRSYSGGDAAGAALPPLGRYQLRIGDVVSPAVVFLDLFA